MARHPLYAQVGLALSVNEQDQILAAFEDGARFVPCRGLASLGQRAKRYAARGAVDYNAFLALLRGQLNQKRLTVVKQAFAKLDPQDSGLVAVEDLKRAFDPSAHTERCALPSASASASSRFARCDGGAGFLLFLCAGRQVREEATRRGAVRIHLHD
jgi:hypothetical protein